MSKEVPPPKPEHRHPQKPPKKLIGEGVQHQQQGIPQVRQDSTAFDEDPDLFSDETWQAMIHYEKFLRKRHPDWDNEKINTEIFGAIRIIEVRELFKMMDRRDLQTITEHPDWNWKPWFEST